MLTTNPLDRWPTRIQPIFRKTCNTNDTKSKINRLVRFNKTMDSRFAPFLNVDLVPLTFSRYRFNCGQSVNQFSLGLLAGKMFY